MADLIQFRRDSKANWESVNPVLAEGEIGCVTDNPNLHKMGNGVDAWNALPYRGFDGTIVHETGDSENVVMSQKAVSGKLVVLEQNFYKSCFTGNDSSFVSTSVYGLIPNHTYRMTLKSTNWDKPIVDGEPMGFVVHAYKDGSNIKSLVGVSLSAEADKQYIFTLPNDFDYLMVGGRATKGTKVWYHLEDVTGIQESEQNIQSLISSANVTALRGVNINTSKKIVDFGGTPILSIGNKTYLLGNIHSESAKYREIPYYESASGNAIILFNLDTQEIYAKDYSYIRTTREVLIGSVVSQFETHEFLMCNFPFSYTIDYKNPWGDDLEKIKADLEQFESEIGTNFFKSYFVGNDGPFVSTSVYGLIPNHTYKLTVKSTNWNKPIVEGEPIGFAVRAFKDGVPINGYVGVPLADETGKEYIFTLPNDFDYLMIGGRATKGTKVWYNLEDVTEIQESKNLIDWDINVKGINHRGWHEAPENTLIAYKKSRQQGFKYVEADVAFTSDGVAVLLHDGTIDRTSNGTGDLSTMTYQEVSQYDFGSWKGSEYSGTKIPTLSEFLTLCRNIGLHPYLEIKGMSSLDNINKIVSEVNANGMRGKTTYVSFYQDYLDRIKSLDNEARLGLLVQAIDDSVINGIRALETEKNEVFILLESALINLAQGIEASIPVEYWTVNSEDDLIQAPSYISGFVSDKLLAGKVLYDNSMNL